MTRGLPTAGAALLALLLPLAAGARDDRDSTAPPPMGVVDTVVVTGNTTTRAYVILNEMSLRPGRTVSPLAIEYDRNRIYSLGLFTRVDILFDTLGGVGTLWVDVGERWHVFPLLYFGFRDGDPRKVYYGAGVLHNNVAGKNQKLSASLILGYDPSVGLSFSDPLIDHDARLSLAAGLSYSRVRNRSEIENQRGEFNEEHLNFDGTLGKRLGLADRVALRAGISRVTVSEYQPGRTVSASGVDFFVHATLSLVHNSRNLDEYPMSGEFAELFVAKSGFGESEVDFQRAGADLRRYTVLPLEITLASRAFGSVAWGGEVPPYARVFFGYGERIRGYFSTVYEGENFAGLTLELRRFVLPPRVVRVSWLPLPPEFAYWRFGIAAALVADAGAAWFRQDPLTLSTFRSGYGGGLDLLLPYSLIVRLHYAFNDAGKGQFILDLRWPA